MDKQVVKKKLYLLSLINLVASGIMYGLNYVFFHYAADDRANGISFMFAEYSATVRKPFITDIMGQLATLLLFFSIAAFMVAIIFFGVKKSPCKSPKEIEENKDTDK